MEAAANGNTSMTDTAVVGNHVDGSHCRLVQSSKTGDGASVSSDKTTKETSAPNSNAETACGAYAINDFHAVVRDQTVSGVSNPRETHQIGEQSSNPTGTDLQEDVHESEANECSTGSTQAASTSDLDNKSDAHTGGQADSSVGSQTNVKENEQPSNEDNATAGGVSAKNEKQPVKSVRKRQTEASAGEKRRKSAVDQLVDTLTPPPDSISERRRRSASRRLLDEYTTQPKGSKSKPVKPKEENTSETQGDPAVSEAEMLARALVSAKYEPGALCMGRCQGFPYWPCIVTCEPETDLFTKLRRRPTRYNPFVTVNAYHVLFFGPHPERSWLEESAVFRFESRAAYFEARDQARENYQQVRERKLSKSCDKKAAADQLQWYTVPASREAAFEIAMKQIEEALAIPTLAERLERYRIAVPSNRQLSSASAERTKRSDRRSDVGTGAKNTSFNRRAASIGPCPLAQVKQRASTTSRASSSHSVVKADDVLRRVLPLQEAQQQQLMAVTSDQPQQNQLRPLIRRAQANVVSTSVQNPASASSLRKRTLTNPRDLPQTVASSDQCDDTDSDGNLPRAKRSRMESLAAASGNDSISRKRLSTQITRSPNTVRNDRSTPALSDTPQSGDENDSSGNGETLEFIMAEDLELTRIGYRVFSPLKHSKRHAFCYLCEQVTEIRESPFLTCAGPCRRTFHRSCLNSSSKDTSEPMDTLDGAVNPIARRCIAGEDDLTASQTSKTDRALTAAVDATSGTKDTDSDEEAAEEDSEASSDSDSSTSSCGKKKPKKRKGAAKIPKNVLTNATSSWRCDDCVKDTHVCALCNKREAPPAALLPIVVSPLRAKFRGQTPLVMALSKEDWIKTGEYSKGAALLSKFNAVSSDGQPIENTTTSADVPAGSSGTEVDTAQAQQTGKSAEEQPDESAKKDTRKPGKQEETDNPSNVAAGDQLHVDTALENGEAEDGGRVFKCKRNDCGRFYHKQCISNYWRLFPACQYAEELLSAKRAATGPAPAGRRGPKRKDKDVNESDDRGLLFTCPAHVCLACLCDDKLVVASCLQSRSVKRLECVRCPTAYHGGDYCIAAGSRELGAGRIVCAKHFRPAGDRTQEKQINITWCFVCSRGGTLLCCEMCPAAFHAECLELDLIPEPFLCGECQQGKAPRYGDIVWAKVGNYRWWPAEVQHPRNVPLNVRKMSKPNDVGLFPVRFYGSHDYYRLARNRTFAYQEGDNLFATGGASAPNRVMREQFKRALNEVTAAYARWRVAKPRAEAETVERHMLGFHVKPPPYNIIKVNQRIGDVRRECDAADEDGEAHECECDKRSESPCGTDSCMNRMLMYECSAKLCAPNCQNQRFVKRQYPRLTAFLTPDGRGWGLRTDELVQRGQFVIEYVGELIDEDEAKRRVQQYARDKVPNYYIIQLDAHRAIDAGPSGNNARFANHSCNPNMETQKWLVNGDYRIGLFALRDIPAGSELTFNYHFQCVGNDKIPCRCRQSNCSGFIGLRPQKGEVERPASSANAKHKAAKRDVKPKRVRHEDECFRCGESGGEMLLCSKLGCPRVYHLACVNQDTVPKGSWYCPWHWCFTCGKLSFTYCAYCPNSFCRKHHDGLLYRLPPANPLDATEDTMDERPKLAVPTNLTQPTLVSEAELKTAKLICWEHPEEIAEAWTLYGLECSTDCLPECAKVRLVGASQPPIVKTSTSDVPDLNSAAPPRKSTSKVTVDKLKSASRSAVKQVPTTSDASDVTASGRALASSYDFADEPVHTTSNAQASSSDNDAKQTTDAPTKSNGSMSRRSRGRKQDKQPVDNSTLSASNDLNASNSASTNHVNGSAADCESGQSSATKTDSQKSRTASAPRKPPALSAVRLSFKLFKNRSMESNAE